MTTALPAGVGTGGVPARLRPTVQYALLAGPLLSMLDSSIVNVAVEPIARQLHASLPVVQWAVSGYLLALGTGLAVTAHLSRRLGTLRLYQLSVLAFTGTSAACAAAPDVQALIVTRVLQGLAAAPLVPLAMSMLFGRGASARSVPATAGMLLFLGPALGPSVGGALIGAVGWRSIFLINVPVGLVAALTIRAIPAELAAARQEAADRLDVPGLLLLAGGLVSLLLGITLAGTSGWASPACWLPVLAGALLLASYAARAGKTGQPVLDLTLVRSSATALALTLCAAASVVTFAVVFLLPVFVQSVQRHSALRDRPGDAAAGDRHRAVHDAGQRALRVVSVRTTVLAGFALLAVASAGVLAINARTPLAFTAALLAVRSVSIGLVIAPLLALLTSRLEVTKLTDGSTLFSICQRIAGSLGIGLIAALYARQQAAHGPVHALHVIGVVIVVIAAAACLAATALPAERNNPLQQR